MDFPSDATGSPQAAPAPRRAQTPRAHLEGAKNNDSGGKACRKVPPLRCMIKMGPLCSAPPLPLLRDSLHSGRWQLSSHGSPDTLFLLHCGGSSLLQGSPVSGRASKGVSHLPAASCTAGQHFANRATEIKPNLLPFPLTAPGLLSAEPLRVTRGVPLPGTAPPAGAKSRVRPQIAD